MAEENKNSISEYEISDKNTDALVYDSEDGAMDVYDLLENYKSDIAVVKINRLIEYGKVPMEVIAEKYSEVAGNITNKDLALMALDSVFFEVALQVTSEPNGIVIDLTTGFRDEELSREQEEALGMDSEASSPNLSKTDIISASIEKSLEKYRERRDAKREEMANAMTNTSQCRDTDRSALEDALKRFRLENKYSEEQQKKDEKEYEKLNYDKSVGKGITDAKKLVIETDPALIIFIDLIDQVNKAKGTPAFNVYISKLNKFIEQDPERKEIFTQITDENRDVLPEYKKQVKEYREQLGIKVFFEKTQYLTEEDAQYLSDNDKKELYMDFISAFKQLGPNNKFYSQIIENIQKIFPEIKDLINENKKFDTKKLFAFTEKVLELDEPLDSKGFAKLMRVCQQELIHRQYNDAQDNEKIDFKLKNNKSPDKIPDDEIDKMFEGRAVEIHMDLNKILKDDGSKTDEEKYFGDSKIVQFSNRDAGNLKRKYKEFNSTSWISEKETAVKLNFLSLVNLKRNLEKLSNIPFYKQKLDETEEKLEQMKLESNDVDFNQYLDPKGNIVEPHKTQILNYKKSKITEKILYDYITDEQLVTSRSDYDELSKEDKQEYLLNTIALLDSRTNMKSTVSKFIARRLELIESNENELVSIEENENGEKIPVINNEALLEEYNKTSSHHFESIEELMQYTKIKELEYVNDKLEEYSNLREEDFFELHGKTKAERSDEIENIRMDFNLRQRDESSKGEETPKITRNPKTTKNEHVDAENAQTVEEKEEVISKDESFSENNNQTALAVTDKKPSLFDRIKDVFSMLTNLTARATNNFFNNQKESEADTKESNVVTEKMVMTFQKVDVNVLEAVQKTEQSRLDASQSSKQNENQMEVGD